MNIQLYYSTSNARQIAKTLKAVPGSTGVAIKRFDSMEPIITVKIEPSKLFNYFSIGGQFYMVTRRTVMGDNLVEAVGKIDPMQTYSSQIMSIEIVTERTGNTGSLMVDDPLLPTTLDNRVRRYSSPHDLPGKSGFFILTTTRDPNGGSEVNDSYAPFSGTKGARLYYLSSADDLLKKLWDPITLDWDPEDIFDAITEGDSGTLSQLFDKKFSDGAILSLRYYPYNSSLYSPSGIWASNGTGGKASENIRVGNLNTGIVANIANDRTSIYGGKVTIPPAEQVHDIMSSTVTAYIPGYGTLDLPAQLAVGKTLHLEYNVSLVSGAATVQIYAEDPNNPEMHVYSTAPIIATAYMDYGIDIPLVTYGGVKNIKHFLIKALATFLFLGNTVGAGDQSSAKAFSPWTSSETFHVIVNREIKYNIQSTANEIASVAGGFGVKKTTVGKTPGFTIASHVKIPSSAGIPTEYHEEIIQFLKDGFYS